MVANLIADNAQMPLTAEEQWHQMANHHEGQWQGLLIRYDGAGQVVDVLDSVRSFTASADRSAFTHALDFRSRVTGTVTQKQWELSPGDPLIIHPVDPTAALLFNVVPADVMIGRDRRSPRGCYFEPYLLAGNKRVSLVMVYKESLQPTAFSFFREVQQDKETPWWTEDNDCAIAPVAQLTLPIGTEAGVYVNMNHLTRSTITCLGGSVDGEFLGEFLHLRFPDQVELFISPNRLETPYYVLMRWQARPNEGTDATTRSCALIYQQPDQTAEVWAV